MDVWEILILILSLIVVTLFAIVIYVAHKTKKESEDRERLDDFRKIKDGVTRKKAGVPKSGPGFKSPPVQQPLPPGFESRPLKKIESKPPQDVGSEPTKASSGMSYEDKNALVAEMLKRERDE